MFLRINLVEFKIERLTEKQCEETVNVILHSKIKCNHSIAPCTSGFFAREGTRWIVSTRPTARRRRTDRYYLHTDASILGSFRLVLEIGWERKHGRYDHRRLPIGPETCSSQTANPPHTRSPFTGGTKVITIFTVFGGVCGSGERSDHHDGRVQHQQPPATATGPHVQMRMMMMVTVPVRAMVVVVLLLLLGLLVLVMTVAMAGVLFKTDTTAVGEHRFW